MSRDILYHGSPEKNLNEILPGKRKESSHPREVFASKYLEVASLFTLSPDTINFMIDMRERRVYICDESEFFSRDQGGMMYIVEGEFRPAADKLIYEFSAPKARVVDRMEVTSAGILLRNRGFDIYADRQFFWEVENYLAANRRFPQELSRRLKPINLL